MTDHSAQDVGSLSYWSISLRTQFCEDLDNDGVKDDYDSCTSVKGVAPSGCPLRTRSVTLTYSTTADEFRGILRCTSAPRCAASQPVRIYKALAGADQLITRTFTSSTGNYVHRRSSVSGTYYAVAPRVFEEGIAECKRAQSANLTL